VSVTFFSLQAKGLDLLNNLMKLKKTDYGNSEIFCQKKDVNVNLILQNIIISGQRIM